MQRGYEVGNEDFKALKGHFVFDDFFFLNELT